MQNVKRRGFFSTFLYEQLIDNDWKSDEKQYDLLHVKYHISLSIKYLKT